MGVRIMSSQTSISAGHSQSTISFPNEAQSAIQSNVEVSVEQNRYANILLFCSWAGICFMVITFVLYMAGAFSPLVEPSQMTSYWSMTVHEYIQATHAPTGWNWLGMINHSDYLNLLGLAFLGSVSVLGYISLFFAYLLKKDLPYTLMVCCEIVIIVLAASGVFHISE